MQCSVNVTMIGYNHTSWTRQNLHMNFKRRRSSAMLDSVKLNWSLHCFTNDISHVLQTFKN